MTDLIKQLEAKRDDLRTVNILLSKLIGRAIDRIRELEAQIETLSIESATSRLAENRERERAEMAESQLFASRDALQGTIQRAEKAEAELAKVTTLYDSAVKNRNYYADERKKAEVELETAHKMQEQDAQDYNTLKAEFDTLESTTIERCAQVIEDDQRNLWTRQDMALAIRALKPSGEDQPEKPINPYLLGGSSTQAEG